VTRNCNGILVLDRAECLRRLGERDMGHLAVTVGALPTIYPLRYVVVDGDVVFRTTPGTTLAGAVRDAVVAFEVDDVEVASGCGWSVVVIGPSRELTGDAEIQAAAALPPTRGRSDDTVVRLRADVVRGRDITSSPPEVLNDLHGR
jgi:nitroimidazol reductase NimA-like FMN-containing flavoprotein (pyridoxamine 5'-phosphate oxidase superfamily)